MITSDRVLDSVVVKVNNTIVARISPEEALTLAESLEINAAKALLGVNQDDGTGI